MAKGLGIVAPRDSGWAGLLEGASKQHYFDKNLRRSLCGKVSILSAIGSLTEIGGDKSCCRGCMVQFESHRSTKIIEDGGWEPRGGTHKRHCYVRTDAPGPRTSLCGNAILLPELGYVSPGIGLDFDESECPACTFLVRQQIVFAITSRSSDNDSIEPTK